MFDSINSTRTDFNTLEYWEKEEKNKQFLKIYDYIIRTEMPLHFIYRGSDQWNIPHTYTHTRIYIYVCVSVCV